MDKVDKEKYRFAPYLRGTNVIEVAYKCGISVATVRKLENNSRPSYTTLKKFYDAGYDIVQSFNY